MMDIRKAEYEIEQLKRKLSQTIEERDRAMSNCNELWKRLNGLMSLAAASTASYTISSGLPTSPSDSYDSANSRSKSTSPNSSAASLNDSLLSSTTTTNQNPGSTNATNTTTNNTTTSNANINSTNNHSAFAKHQNGHATQNGSTQIIPINLKRPIEAINNNHLSNNNNNIVHHNNSSSNNNHLSHHKSNNNNISHNLHHHHHNNHLSNGVKLEKSPLKNSTLLPDKNNNHPLIVEVPKDVNQTVGDIVEIAPGQFKCRYCDKTFDRIFSVHRHERVHTGYKPCKCNECGRGFSEKRNLRHHIIRFHSDGSGRELLKRNRNKVSNSANNGRQQFLSQSNGSMMNQSNGNHHSQITATNVSSVISKGGLQQLHQRQLNNNSSNQSTNGIKNQTLSSLANGNDHNNNNNSSSNSNSNHSNVLQTICRAGAWTGDGDIDDMDEDVSEGDDEDIGGVEMADNSDYRALCSQLTSLKDELIDTSGLSVLGAAAAVITVNSSSSRRRKSKPSKKIITNS